MNSIRIYPNSLWKTAYLFFRFWNRQNQKRIQIVTRDEILASRSYLRLLLKKKNNICKNPSQIYFRQRLIFKTATIVVRYILCCICCPRYRSKFYTLQTAHEKRFGGTGISWMLMHASWYTRWHFEHDTTSPPKWHWKQYQSWLSLSSWKIVHTYTSTWKLSLTAKRCPLYHMVLPLLET